MSDEIEPAPIPDEIEIAPSSEALVEILDRVVHRGAVLRGDAVISLAGIALVRVDLRVMLLGIDGLEEP